MTWSHLMLILWLLAFKLMFCMNCKWNHVFWCSKVSLSLKFIMYILLLIFSLEFDFINCKILLHLKVTKSNFKGLCSIKQRKLYSYSYFFSILMWFLCFYFGAFIPTCWDKLVFGYYSVHYTFVHVDCYDLVSVWDHNRVLVCWLI